MEVPCRDKSLNRDKATRVESDGDGGRSTRGDSAQMMTADLSLDKVKGIDARLLHSYRNRNTFRKRCLPKLIAANSPLVPTHTEQRLNDRTASKMSVN